MQLVPDLSVFTDLESVERRPFSSARSRPRPERGQKCLGSPPWLDDHGKHPAQEGGSAIARRGRETCVFIILIILTLLLCMRVPEHLFGLPQSKPPKNQTSEP
jgi:hypothetical protein